MAQIDPPKRQERYPDRDIDCQQAIEYALHDLIDNVRAAGWAEHEIVEAIDQLTLAYRMGREENIKLEAMLQVRNWLDRARRG
ncbi:hypothetical protein [Pseudaminobacter soli (ex Li et al. 2025)]|uniref:Uncharacterized protein n=1 Tax=Pseudaminobacter soli (ex Li et al. 2025) TaxID=1295366 RepID=A0A2P7RTV8_9HYPH|nr:hypothetical protein [Mesorhizobium soli]PSJ53657.1 hypothetical protein C7I85_27940 [Mesorhizobium soli]